MTPDFGFVAYPAQRLTYELTARRLRNAFAERSLTHAWRADEAEDRALQLACTGLDGEIFDDTILDLFKPIMIRIEHFLRRADVLLYLAFLAPGQTQQDVEVVSDDGRFGAHRLHGLELLQFAFGLLARFLAEFGLGNLFGQFGNLVAAVFVTAELVLDRFQLFVEIIFALRTLHLPLYTAADAPFHLQHGKLAFHVGHHHFQPLERVLFNQ